MTSLGIVLPLAGAPMLCIPVEDFFGAVSQLENAKVAKMANPKATSVVLCLFFMIILFVVFYGQMVREIFELRSRVSSGSAMGYGPATRVR